MWSWSSKRPPPKRASIVPHQTTLTREGFGEVVVVNQSRFSNSGGHYGKRARLLKGSRVDELRILLLDQRLEGQTGGQPRSQSNRITLASGVCVRSLADRGADSGRGPALVLTQVDVALAEGQRRPP